MASGINTGKPAHRGTMTVLGRGRGSHHSQCMRERSAQSPPTVPRPLQYKQDEGAGGWRVAETMRGEGRRPAALAPGRRLRVASQIQGHAPCQRTGCARTALSDPATSRSRIQWRHAVGSADEMTDRGIAQAAKMAPGASAGRTARAPRCTKTARGRSERLRDRATRRIVRRDRP